MTTYKTALARLGGNWLCWGAALITARLFFTSLLAYELAHAILSRAWMTLRHAASSARKTSKVCSQIFYFGCEAEDHALAFNERNNPFGARLNAFFGSDIGHFDVQDMASDLPEP